jgi:hypothetical protein
MASGGPAPRPPITIDDNGDLEVYEDVGSACADCEVYDVHKLGAFDSHGVRLHFVTPGYQVVDLVITDGEPVPGDLATRLRGFIRRVGPDRVGLRGFESEPLAILLEALLAFFRDGSR